MAPLGEKDTGGGAHMSDTNDKIRIVQETVAGKEITFAHVIGGPAPIIYQKLGLNPAIDYGAAAIGIIREQKREKPGYRRIYHKFIHPVEDENGEKHKVAPLIETKRGIGYMIRAPKN